MVVVLDGEVGRSEVMECERVFEGGSGWVLPAVECSEEGTAREVALMADAPGLLALSQTGRGGM